MAMDLQASIAWLDCEQFDENVKSQCGSTAEFKDELSGIMLNDTQ